MVRPVDCYLLLTWPSHQFNTVELRFQFRYAAPQPPRLLQLELRNALVLRECDPPEPSYEQMWENRLQGASPTRFAVLSRKQNRC